jgi:predicted ATPase
LFKHDLNYFNALLFSKIRIAFSDGGKSNDDKCLALEFEKGKISYDSLQSYSHYWKESQIYFIKDQRLTYSIAAKRDGTFKRDGKIGRDGVAVLNRIDLLSENLVGRISQIKSEEEKEDKALNASYAKRLFKYNKVIPKAEFEKRYEELTEKYQLLQKYNIYQNDLEKAEYEGENQRAFSIYLEDWEIKIAIYDELLAKIDLFLSIMDAKCLSNKMFTIDAAQGFCFTSSGGKPLELDCLSSGEQHETILLYELLFNAPPDSLVLIDEPETSMHVAWQIEFLHDIEKIAKLSKLSFIIATHAPDLINDKMDLCVDLFENTRRNGNDGK